MWQATWKNTQRKTRRGKTELLTPGRASTAGLGKTINFLILDEFAWCPPNDVELFYNNIIPTVTTMSDANVCIMSTQNGFNLFYKLWRDSVEKKNIYGHYKIDWNQVPQWNKQKQMRLFRQHMLRPTQMET